jgi:hypothetical protein
MIHKTIVPKKREIKLSFTVPEDYVGEEVEVIAFIKKDGLSQPEAGKLRSPALPGAAMSNQQFIDWITQSETMPTVSLDDAKRKWTNKRLQLRQLIK